MSSFQHSLALAYGRQGIPLDQLPYTKAIRRIIAEARTASGTAISARECWHELLNLRKRGHLPRVGRIRKRSEGGDKPAR